MALWIPGFRLAVDRDTPIAFATSSKVLAPREIATTANATRSSSHLSVFLAFFGGTTRSNVWAICVSSRITSCISVDILSTLTHDLGVPNLFAEVFGHARQQIRSPLAGTHSREVP